jgi:hypothetical protein
VAAGALDTGAGGRTLLRARSFFGVHRVVDAYAAGYRLLYHGTTLHGLQSTDPARRREPLGYFHPTGPLGQAFAAGQERGWREVAVVGLGAGSIACYAQPGQRWTFYEIDPVVERIARDPRLFSYLKDCAPAAEVVLGDGRLSLSRAAAGRFDLLVIDAYSSEALPIHLVTREAMRTYFGALARGGLLLLNITNQHLDVEPVLADLARDAEVLARVRDDADVTPEELERGKINSKWMAIARNASDLGPLAHDPRWKEPRRQPGARLWTDDFSSLASVLTLD